MDSSIATDSAAHGQILFLLLLFAPIVIGVTIWRIRQSRDVMGRLTDKLRRTVTKHRKEFHMAMIAGRVEGEALLGGILAVYPDRMIFEPLDGEELVVLFSAIQKHSWAAPPALPEFEGVRLLTLESAEAILQLAVKPSDERDIQMILDRANVARKEPTTAPPPSRPAFPAS